MARIIRDNESELVNEHYAVIYSPRRNRDRFPDNCVHLHDNMDEALDAADPDRNLHPAKVVGPSRSSEGFMLYYLEYWLD